MNNKKIAYFTLAVFLGITLILGIIILAFKNNGKLSVYFLDVGQGDAILITNGANQVLIDSGRSGKIVLEKLGQAMPFWDRKLEALIITHPDADHYGGFNEILDFYKVENIIRTSDNSEGGEWLALIEKIKDNKINSIESVRETKIVFPAGAELKIIYPPADISQEKDKNNNSIVARLVFGQNEFLFTGDLSVAGENFLANSSVDIQADFLKIGHHGSKSSSSANFLDKVSPRDAIISVGKGNTYGHPHKEVLDSLKNRTVRVWRTDEDGTIEYKCKNINEICQAGRI
ncbi:MAG: hypothetical protein ACD_7C00551G0006 [uncultured bacterium]|nr:MAG: hypothetical protein ACD_7C00551G0006 [uncultured bacterium]KKP68363.1 MAG: Metallo-beta-lactamase superfamily protein [Candidatus Moranbacteria bacterium GW2011_GWE1_35_17]KKP81551.1 MAG: Metallo-beta-lactamase superfamily protein [Candidatus Moranbacteria bacterium GW2011_GWF2_35_54]HBR79413.1 hypothetical protein [Candidatus Moranbacteria bacterium]